MGRVLFVTRVSAPGQDASLQAIIARRGHTVVVVDQDTAEPSNGEMRSYDFVVISESVISGNVGTKYVNARVPVLLLEPALVEEHGFCTERTSGTDGTTFTTVQHGHPLTAGRTGGTAFSGGSGLYTMTTFPNASDSVVIVSNSVNLGLPWQFYIPKGGVRVSLTPAPALRLFFGAHSDSYNQFTTDGLALINAALAMCERPKVKSLKRFLLSEAPASGGTGTLNKTLGVLTLSSAGTLNITGSLSKTFGVLVLDSDSSISIIGTLSKTLGVLTLTSSSAGGTEGTLAKTFGVLTLAGAATLSISATVTKTFGVLVVNTAGVLGITGALNKTLGTLTLFGRSAADSTGVRSKFRRFFSYFKR